MRRLLAALAMSVAICSTAAGQLPGMPSLPVDVTPASASHVQATAVASLLRATAGERFHVALDLRIDEGWVYYSPDPGQIVQPATLTVDAPGLAVGEPLWPGDERESKAIGSQLLVNNVYTSRAIIYVPITVPADATAGRYRITLTPGGQICADVCMNLEGVTAAVSIEVADRSVPNPAWTGRVAGGLADAVTAGQLKARHARSTAGGPTATTVVAAVGSAAGRMTLWAGLGLALLAGLTLNIMPCVLPVIPLRILSVVSMAKQSRRRFVTLGLAFAGGIVLFFAALAAINISVRLASGASINVSDHFTYPGVRIAMAMILVALAVNLFGGFTVTVPSRVASIEATRRAGHVKSAAMGFMMAVLATPCSFAYLLAAMAWAQVQPLWLGTVAMLLIGVGMAGPHVLLCAFPGLVEKLPAPGRWMELFRRTMGFALLPVAIWLISTLGTATWPFWVAAYGVVLAFSLWIWGTWVRYDAPFKRKVLVRGSAVLVALVGAWWMLPAHKPLATKFEHFAPGLISPARQQGRIVLVKVTASWCTECLVVDHTVYNRPDVARELADRNVLVMKADVTDRASPASEWVRRHFDGAPPMTIIYPPDGRQPRVLVGLFSPKQLFDALAAAALAAPTGTTGPLAPTGPARAVGQSP